ncbi:MAG TPA: hypothetical protein DCX07_08685 [Phycisphaerales bacterium]|nr:hypothetical protein [Phycisphaerales bacterium]
MRLLLAYILVFLTVLAPGFYLGFGLPTIHIGDILLLLSLPCLWLASDRSFQRLIFPPHMAWITSAYYTAVGYILFLTIVLIPIYASTLVSVSIFAVLGMFKPIVLGIVLYALVDERRRVNKVSNFLLFMIFAEVLLMVCQKYGYFGVNQWLSPMYRVGEFKSLYLLGDRVYGSFGNPNDAGTALSLLGTMAYARVVFGQKKWFLPSSVATVLSLVGCVWLAKTRQGTACLLAGCAVVQFLAIMYTGRRGWASLTAVLVIIGLIVGLFYLEADPVLAKRFGMFTGESVERESSIAARLALWPTVFDIHGMSLFVGMGMAARIGTETVWDSGYINTVICGGLPSLIGLLLIFFTPAAMSLRRMRWLGASHEDFWIFATCAAIFPPLLLTNIINDTLNISRIMSIPVMIYVVMAIRLRLEEEQWTAEWESDALLAPESWTDGRVTV